MLMPVFSVLSTPFLTRDCSNAHYCCHLSWPSLIVKSCWHIGHLEQQCPSKSLFTWAPFQIALHFIAIYAKEETLPKKFWLSGSVHLSHWTPIITLTKSLEMTLGLPRKLLVLLASLIGLIDYCCCCSKSKSLGQINSVQLRVNWLKLLHLWLIIAIPKAAWNVPSLSKGSFVVLAAQMWNAIKRHFVQIQTQLKSGEKEKAKKGEHAKRESNCNQQTESVCLPIW